MDALTKRETRCFVAAAVLWFVAILVPFPFPVWWNVATVGVLLVGAGACLWGGMTDPARRRTPLESANAAEKIRRRRERGGDQR